jgi:hypothetical protein
MTERTNDPEYESRRDSGRLREQGSGLTDHEKDEVATEEPEDIDGRSAEEAAVRVEEEPEGLTGGPDRYVEDDQETG